ncbi:MAG: ABC transporter ATP-binding protein [Elusimicrobia bacterium]|nr:ABC transporter ATP-binding protein [Elusimicrobiota bacterium]
MCHVYPAKGKIPARQALSDVSFEVRTGETFGLLGPNGGGKSTLFKILSTYLTPSSGSVSLFGFNLTSQPREIRPLLGVVFQSPSLDPKLTVRENMRHQGRLYGLCGAELSGRIEEMLERYRLKDRAEDLAESLSGGLKRRVELAKGLLHRPQLLLLDEPSTGLDPGARKDLWEHLGDLKTSSKVTILVTTHLMEEAERCDRLVLLDQGKIAAQGAPLELKSEIGGDVISIEAENPPALQGQIRERFSLEASLVDGLLRLEKKEGHAFIPQLVESFPGAIKTVSLSKPSLEDVFIHHTGRRFWAPGERA